ncbi:replication initiation protein [Carnobacterium funditum]|uniref:replication initiation protein n=1 Tax=Carnobacterium funditum TaxID=2752 RepID=UPI00068F769C|nr:replication initiation protein [Carnobacterium funditum]
MDHTIKVNSIYQNMNQEVIELNKEYTVAKDNQLVQKAKINLTEKELKLIDWLISKIKPNDEELLQVETSVAEINLVLGFGNGGKNIKHTKDALLNLSNKGFWIQSEDESGIEIARWIDEVSLKYDGKAVLKLHSKLAPYLLQLAEKGNYTSYYLRTIISLKSKYSLLLYQLAKSGLHNGVIGGEVKEIQEYFGHKDLTWGVFNGRYLKKAIEEVNTKTDLHIEMLLGKNGRNVVRVEFRITKKLRKEVSEKPQVPMYNWLES